MPLDVAVEEEHARVGGLEPQDGVGPGVDGDDVAHGRLGGEAVGAARVVARPAAGAVHDLELVPVQVEGVDGVVVVVDDDVDDVVGRHDERVDLAVDYGVGVVVARRRGRVQGRDFLGDVGLAVDTSTKDCQQAWRVQSVSELPQTYRPIPF